METDALSLLIVNPMGGAGWGGVERWLFDLAVGLRARGHRVTAAGQPDSAWSERTAEAGFDVCRVPLRSDFAPGQRRTLAAFMRRHEVDVVATKLHRGIRVSGFAARAAGRPPVVAFMGLVETEPGWRYRLTYRLFLDRVVTLSDAMREEIATVGRLDPATVVTIPYGIRPGEYELPPATRAEVRAELGVPPDAPVALALGRMHLQKRFDVLLEAFRRVVDELPAARLVVAGEGRLLTTVDAQRRRLGLESSVTLLGFRRDVARLLAASDCLVLSSDFEGLPMVVLEAMASARAVVSTNVGSLPAMVEHGRTGLLVPKGEPAALADALTAVLASPDRGRAMGEAGRARVLERYPLERCIVETERYLLSVRRRS
jgi:glycosyltransferase involved in cell wall biosynthesis